MSVTHFSDVMKGDSTGTIIILIFLPEGSGKGPTNQKIFLKTENKAHGFSFVWELHSAFLQKNVLQ